MLPSSNEASSGVQQWVLGVACLVEVVLRPGKRASRPLAMSAVVPIA